MTPLRVLTVDDEPLARERISALVRQTDALELVGEARNGLEALDLISSLEPDLVFIDVEMPELSGFGVVAAIDGPRIPGVVFVTAFERYALQAFDVGAIDYLHKPVTVERFNAAVERSRDRLTRLVDAPARSIASDAAKLERARGQRTRFVVRNGPSHYFVPVADVDWIDVADNYLQLHVGARVHLCRGTLNDAVDELNASRFVRIHRSTLVAIDRIKSVTPRDSGGYIVLLQSGARLNASRSYSASLRALRNGSLDR
jgi:two-component system LytT family response regulator